MIQALIRQAATKFKPPPNLLVSEWADEYRRLSPEASALPGAWSNAHTPHLVAPMNACSPSDPCETVVLKFSSQSGKTEVILNFLGYIMHLDPGPILVVQPSQKPMAEAFSKDRVSTMIRDTPTLTDLVSPAKSRDGKNTIFHKSFPGGHLTIGGSNSPSGLASRPIRYFLADEIDRWTETSEGDALALGEVRTQTFPNRKIVKVSSPTYDDSGIDAEYQAAEQQFELQLQCPSCHRSQFPRLGHFEIDFDQLGASQYQCAHCKTLHGFQHEMRIKKTAHWVQTKANGEKSKGFWANQFASPLSRWTDTLQKWHQARDDPAKLRVVTNTAFAEGWVEKGETVDETGLLNRREQYGVDPLPAGVLVLVCGVDVQQNRLEMEVIGYGAGHESWGIEYAVLYGDPRSPEVWADLDARLGKTYHLADGASIRISATCIDSGGHATQHVYDFCRPRRFRNVFPVKGRGGPGVPVTSAPRKIKYGKTPAPIFLVTVGVDDAKAIIYARLRKPDPGVEFCHFPQRYPENYFLGLTAEKRMRRRKHGFDVYYWEKIRPRNEPLDIRVYALAAVTLLNPDYDVLAQKDPDHAPKIPKPKRAPRERLIR